MDQHPVPQDISTYQFRLVGDMTLKQFLELGGGVLLAVLMFNSGLPFLFKWPLVILSAASGAAFAFLPFEERPLDIWIKNFFRAIYFPTQYLWKKQEKLPDFFTTTFVSQKTEGQPKITQEEKAKFAEYLKTLPPAQAQSAFDKIETESLNKINAFLQSATQLNPVQFSQGIAPQTLPTSGTNFPSVRIRKLKQGLKTSGEKLQNIPTTASLMAAPIIEIAQPFNAPVEIGTPYPAAVPSKPIARKPKIKNSVADIASVTSQTLPIPNLPEIPNVVVGMVLDSQGKILPGAIIEIQDKDSMPVRASKTNKLGQFFIVTPLSDGEYELNTEADRQIFDIIKFKAEGKIIEPIKIKAKGANSETQKQKN